MLSLKYTLIFLLFIQLVLPYVVYPDPEHDEVRFNYKNYFVVVYIYKLDRIKIKTMIWRRSIENTKWC